MDSDFVRENVIDDQNSVEHVHTSLMAARIFIGTHQFVPTERVHITSRGIRIIGPNVRRADDKVILDIQTREVVKIVSCMKGPQPVIFVYVLNSCGAYIRDSLEMQKTIHDNSTPFFNPSATTDYYKRIVLLLDDCAEETRSVIRTIYEASRHDEITQRDAAELLERSRIRGPRQAANAGGQRNSTGSSGASNSAHTSNNNNNNSNSGAASAVGNAAGALLSQAAGGRDDENIRQILIYPKGKGGISINTEDYMCLAIDQYLNDVIIDFYLKYLLIERLSDEQRQRTHVFSTFFYKRLTTMTSVKRGGEQAKMTASQKRHFRVKTWTKAVNLFEKDYIIIPINEQSHWFLAIVCFPSLKGPVTMDGDQPVQPAQMRAPKRKERKRVALQIGNTTITPVSKRELHDTVFVEEDDERDEAEGDESDLASEDSDVDASQTSTATAPERGGNGVAASSSTATAASKPVPVKQPCILIFDSLAGVSRSRVVATLRDYLNCEYRVKMPDSAVHTFTKDTIPGHSVKVPQQNNFTDCGLFLLQYVEQFFAEPIADYHIPIKTLHSWFDTMVVTRKREEISDLLIDLVRTDDSRKLPLPDIKFPTLNGKLLEVEETFNEDGEFEEEEMEDEMDAEEDMNEEHLESETDSSPTKQLPSPTIQTTAKNSSNHNNVSTSKIQLAPTIPATTTVSNSNRTIFKRIMETKQKTESARKMGRFDELKRSS